MSRMLLRQCHSLREVHYNSIRCLTRPHVKRSLATAFARGYTAATPNETPIARLLGQSAILIPQSIKDIRPDDFLQRIDPTPQQEIATNSFCIILVTPSVASWLEDDTVISDDAFLAQAVRRVYGKCLRRRSGQLQVEVLCAVVDKLPAGKSTEPGASLQGTVEQYAINYATGDTGFEGIAFATLPSVVSRSSASANSQEKGAIDFTFNGQSPEDKRTLYDTWRLPLANTVFQTGKPTTMFTTRWDLNAESRSPILLERKKITHHNIDLAFSKLLPQTSSILNIPLLPLTLPRTADGCMGNIIRRVVGPGDESITASSELEMVVPEFFKACGESARPTTVWALVLPKAKKQVLETRTKRLLGRRIGRSEKGSDMLDLLWQRLWQAEDPWKWNTLVTTALAEGARLHRVLSGGGGWGKKAGLLSLDPVPVAEQIPIRAEDASSGFDGPGDLSSALTPVIQEGDAIQFFIQPPQSDQPDENKRIASLKPLSKHGIGGLEFGTVPSTIDSIPGHAQQPAITDSGYVAVFKNSFGALTEGGLTLTRNLEPPRPVPAQHPVYTTTIDVPYSRMWTVGVAEVEGSAKHVKFSWEHESMEFAAKLKKKADAQKKQTESGQNKKAGPKPIEQAHSEQPTEADSQQSNQSDSQQPIEAYSQQPNEAYWQQPNEAYWQRPDEADSQQPNEADSQQPNEADSQQPNEADSQQPNEADSQQPGIVKQLFRRVVAPYPPKSELPSYETRLAGERLHGIESNVEYLDAEYRSIWHNINRRLLKDLPAHIRRVTRKSSIRAFVANEAPPIPRAVASNLTLAAQTQRILNATNFYAFETYGLHLRLRLRLGQLIMQQTGPDGRQWLATHLIELRHFDEDLYYRKRDQPKQQIAQKLLDLELRSKFQRTVVLPRVPSAMRLGQEQKGLKTLKDMKGHKKLSIRYRRLRISSTDTLQGSRSMRMRRQIIRQHFSETRRSSPIRRLPVGPRARRMRSSALKTKRVSIRSTSKSKRDELVNLASVWLGDQIAAADPVKSSPRRPFGSRALSEEDRGNATDGEGTERSGEVQRKPGRVRPFGRQR